MTSALAARRRKAASSGYGVALLSGAGWGVSNIVNGLALAMAPFALSARWLLAPLVAATLYEGLRAVWQVAYVGATRRWRDLSPVVRCRRGSLYAAAAALAGGPWATGFFFLSIALAGVTYGVTISATAPAFGALWGAVFLRDRIGPRGWAGVLLSVAGAAVVAYHPPEGAPPHFYLGVLCAVLTALGWSFEALCAQRAMGHLTPTAVATVRQVLSFVVLAAVLVPLLGGAGLFVEAVASPSALVLFAAALAGAASYQLYFVAVHLVGLARAMPLNLTYVLWTALLGVVFLSEPPTWQLGVGAVAIVAGASLVVRSGRLPEEAAVVAGPAPLEVPVTEPHRAVPVAEPRPEAAAEPGAARDGGGS